jgi:hypothetical protein
MINFLKIFSIFYSAIQRLIELAVYRNLLSEELIELLIHLIINNKIDFSAFTLKCISTILFFYLLFSLQGYLHKQTIAR